MDESAQQAVQLGVNVTIFIIALSISVTLLLGVRDVADVASEYNASIPTGSRVVNVDIQNKRIVSGYELLSYYANYMTDINNERTGKFVLTIEDNGNVVKEENVASIGEPTISNLKLYLKNKGINLAKDYEVITERYNENAGVLEITLKSIK